MKGKTAFEKIVTAHQKKILPDGRMVLSLDRIWCHEITTPNAILDARDRGCDVVFNPNMIKAMIDHVTPAKDTASALQGKILREWCQQHGVEFLDIGRNGICHAIIPEKGWVLPGEIGIMGDSHTCTHGAFCAFAAGVGTTDLEAGITTGLWICPPQKVIRVNFVGILPLNVFAKDLILTLIKKVGVKGATNSVLEIGGSVIDGLSMDARMTITNMAVEAGATSGMMMVDEETVRYLWPVLRDKYCSLDEALAELVTWNSDADCEYDQIVTIDVTGMNPVITQNYSPGDVVTVQELAGKPVNQVYIGSCTNGRLEDLQIAADIFRRSGKSVADNVRCIVVPATPDIWNKANKEGLLGIFMAAGCCVTNPTCGACLGMSCGVLAPGEICVSTTNRNFPGRMGKDGMVHLASPATAAMTAINGVISTPDSGLIIGSCFKDLVVEAVPSRWEKRAVSVVNYAELAAVQLGSAKDFSGKVFYLLQENIDTDQIIPAKYLTETDKAALGQHCLEDADIPAELRAQLRECQILVAGENFGCGSSREHAPWALEAAGIRCVIAPSFARIFYENMFNNGLLCIVATPDAFKTLVTDTPDYIKVNWPHAHCEWPGKRYHFELSSYQMELIKNGGSVGGMLKLAAELSV